VDKESRRAIRKHARAWMIIHDLRILDIQRELGMNNPVMISETFAGKKNNTAVLNLLREKGCPVEYLALPERMIEGAV